MNGDLFEQHLRLLEGRATAADAAEAARVAAVRLRPLPRPIDSRAQAAGGGLDAPGSVSGSGRDPVAAKGVDTGARAIVLATLAAALAAAALVVVLVRPTATTAADDLGAIRFKGGARVWPVWQRGDAILPWQTGAATRNGDRFSAEVSATEASVAFLGILAGDGTPLSDAALVASRRLALRAGERQRFPHGFELVGEDEGERLAVVVCPAAAADAVLSLPGGPLSAGELPAGCVATDFPLR